MAAAILLQTLLSAVDPDLLAIGGRISIIGMTIVFSGLVILSLSLPLIRKLAEGKSKKSEQKDDGTLDTGELTEEEIVAITVAIHAHFAKISRMEDMQLTWEMYDKPYSPWRLAGRSRILMDRTAFSQRNRSR